MHRGTIRSVKDIKKEWSVYDTVTFKNKKTTVGRVIFNSLLPAKYPFVDEDVDKKKLNSILMDIFKLYGEKVFLDTIDKISRTGFEYYTVLSKSISLNDLEIPEEIEKLRKELAKIKDPVEFDKMYQKLIKELEKYLAKYGYDVYDIVKSGARGSWRQLAQMLIAKGIVVDPSGNVMKPITSAFADGLSPTEYFKGGIGARSGVADRTLSTATTGYLTRRLVFATQSVLLSKLLDCKTKQCLTIKVEPSMVDKLIGRYLKDGTIISESYAKKLVGKTIELRSPIFCKSNRICRTCYGKLADYVRSDKIGIIAAETLGEPGTQLVMRAFHLGGVVSFNVIDVLADLVKYNPTYTRKHFEEIIEQKDTKLIAKTPVQIIINKEDYPTLQSISYNKEDGTLFLNVVVATCIPQDKPEFHFILNSAALFTDVEETGTQYIVNIPANKVICELKASSDRFAQVVQQAINILEGRVPWKTVEQLVLNLYSLYHEQASHIALVHYEVVFSNLLRNKHNPTLPARLVDPYEPVLYGLKKIPYVDGNSWLLGLSFENAGKAIETGLLAGDRQREITPLEKVLLGITD